MGILRRLFDFSAIIEATPSQEPNASRSIPTIQPADGFFESISPPMLISERAWDLSPEKNAEIVFENATQADVDEAWAILRKYPLFRVSKDDEDAMQAILARGVACEEARRYESCSFVKGKRKSIPLLNQASVICHGYSSLAAGAEKRLRYKRGGIREFYSSPVKNSCCERCTNLGGEIVSIEEPFPHHLGCICAIVPSVTFAGQRRSKTRRP